MSQLETQIKSLFNSIVQLRRQVKQLRTYYLGTVTQTIPHLQVKVDGDDQPLSYTPVQLNSSFALGEGKRVVLAMLNRRLCIIGVIGETVPIGGGGTGMVSHGNEWHNAVFETTVGAQNKANAAETAAKAHADNVAGVALFEANIYTDQQVQQVELTPGPPGPGLEFTWNGTQLGVRIVGQQDYVYVDLQGDPGVQGEVPAHQWNGTEISFKNPDGTWGDWIDLKGPSGEKGDKPAHQWDGTQLRLENPDGSWGSYVDLKGEPGSGGGSASVVHGVRVHRNVYQGIPPYGDYVEFTDVDWDTTNGDMWDDNDPTMLIAPEDGWYLIQGSFMLWADFADDTAFGVVLTVNDLFDADFGGKEVPAGEVAEAFKLSTTMPLLAGSYIRAFVLNESDDTAVVLNYAPTMPSLQMTKIGDL